MRAPVSFLKSGQLSRRHGHIAVVMRHYPRFTPKELIDEYVSALAPDPELFSEFKAKDRELKDHDRAFALVRYEERFALTDEGRAHLARLSALSRAKDVYLMCQCTHDERCHCDLLLLMARRLGAVTGQLPYRYPVFEERLENLGD